jgi:hypothetical protein
MSPKLKEKSKMLVDKFDFDENELDTIEKIVKSYKIPIEDSDLWEILKRAHAVHTESKKRKTSTYKSLINDITGVMGEFAAAKYYDLPWVDTIGTFKKADLGKRIQARASEYKTGRLPFRREDLCNLDHAFVFSTGEYPEMEMRGWLYGYECISDKSWWKNMGKTKLPYAWFIPQSALRAPETLDLKTVNNGSHFKKLFGKLDLDKIARDTAKEYGITNIDKILEKL